ncbi:MAG: Kae1-associated serine/threonine protein kinase [Candidatus Odinarchaeum yellowstonii]|uniref:non-specific serine/threonine protein kinase n=1 Tax=Odinarchaeota yellowstonii (strain LCB_4) TaxID=1841599 RepID=A0AAF0D150_ODILC|nr:MAG: Kae1-associated serine/threonine protein kinase [Candidatus Odinarchaeum yellowstonii]
MLIAKGAEACLYKSRWHGFDVVVKERIKKNYRHPILDHKLRAYRTVSEARMMNEARAVGVPTPIVYDVDLENTRIIYEYIEGVKIKNIIERLGEMERRNLNRRIGLLIGLLHKHGLIHGDLTTSNMLLKSSGNIYFIDFGLCEHSNDIENKGVDLHLMKRALESTHFRIASTSFREILEGYRETAGDEAEEVIKRISLIEKRGRYISDRR